MIVLDGEHGVYMGHSVVKQELLDGVNNLPDPDPESTEDNSTGEEKTGTYGIEPTLPSKLGWNWWWLTITNFGISVNLFGDASLGYKSQAFRYDSGGPKGYFNPQLFGDIGGKIIVTLHGGLVEASILLDLTVWRATVLDMELVADF